MLFTKEKEVQKNFKAILIKRVKRLIMLAKHLTILQMLCKNME